MSKSTAKIVYALFCACTLALIGINLWQLERYKELSARLETPDTVSIKIDDSVLDFCSVDTGVVDTSGVTYVWNCDTERMDKVLNQPETESEWLPYIDPGMRPLFKNYIAQGYTPVEAAEKVFLDLYQIYREPAQPLSGISEL